MPPAAAIADAQERLPRILIVGPVPPPYGGMSVQGALLVERLREAGVPVRRLPTNPPLGVLGKVPLVRTLASTLVFVGRLLATLPRVDVVHVLAASGFYYAARTAPAIVLGRLFRRRVVVNYRGGLAAGFFARHRIWASWILRRASVLTVPSAFLARVFSSLGFRPVVVPNVTNLERFRFRDRSRLRPRLLVNRNFEGMYNIGLALDAFARLQARYPDASLTLAGSGPEEAALRAKVAALGLRAVEFAGRVENERMAALYDDHDLWVNPTDVDNMPISVLECMASGLPVVSTKVGGVPDLVADGVDGLLVPPRDADAMATALRRLLEEPGLAAALVRAGRAKAESFRWSEVLPRLLAVYRGDPA